MIESIEEGLRSKPGRNPENPEQEFGVSRSLEETYDDRGLIHRTLESTHDAVTSRTGKTLSFLTGSGAVLSYNEGFSLIGDSAVELSYQHPEASAVVLGVSGALLYNAADEIGFLSNARQALNPDQLRNAEGDSYLELGDESVDSDLEGHGIKVDVEAVEDIEVEPELHSDEYVVLHEGLDYSA